MEERALADRLVNYADALAAVAFVGASGLTIALADPDVRCSITQGAYLPVTLGNAFSATFVTAVLIVLRRWENDLRASRPLSQKVSRYSGRIYVARFFAVWVSAIFAVGALVASSRDPGCLS
jgi:hypothetical protein